VTEALLAFDLAGAALRWILGAAFGCAGLLCLLLTLMGLPGLWGLLLLAGGLQLSDLWLRDDGGHTFHPWTLVIAVLAALGAEALEFAAGAAGAKRGGASRRGMIGAAIGGVVGAIAGSPFGLIVGAIVGSVLGSALGAIVAELTLPGRSLESTFKPATGAAVGRLQGLLGKLVITAVLWIGLTIAVFVP
jgi:uncharacterized protein YqgC (DUF456 family)